MLHIIALDDQSLFRASLQTALEKCFPDAILNYFSTNDDALEYITECFQKKTRIDIIITDLNHGGEPNGLAFAEGVRELERDNDINKIPILLLTFNEVNEDITYAIEVGMIDVYISKCADAPEIAYVIRKLTGTLE